MFSWNTNKLLYICKAFFCSTLLKIWISQYDCVCMIFDSSYMRVYLSWKWFERKKTTKPWRRHTCMHLILCIKSIVNIYISGSLVIRWKEKETAGKYTLHMRSSLTNAFYLCVVIPHIFVSFFHHHQLLPIYLLQLSSWLPPNLLLYWNTSECECISIVYSRYSHFLFAHEFRNLDMICNVNIYTVQVLRGTHWN